MTWATSVPILAFLVLSVLELRPMYATDRRQTKASLNAPPIRGGGIIEREQISHVQHVCATLTTKTPLFYYYCY